MNRIRTENGLIHDQFSIEISFKNTFLNDQLSKLCKFQSIINNGDLKEIHRIYPVKERNRLLELFKKHYHRIEKLINHNAALKPNLHEIEKCVMKANWEHILFSNTEIPYTAEELTELNNFYEAAASKGFTSLFKQEYSQQRRSELLAKLEEIRAQFKKLQYITEYNESTRFYNLFVKLTRIGNLKAIETKILFLNRYDHIFSHHGYPFSALTMTAEIEQTLQDPQQVKFLQAKLTPFTGLLADQKFKKHLKTFLTKLKDFLE